MGTETKIFLCAVVFALVCSPAFAVFLKVLRDERKFEKSIQKTPEDYHFVVKEVRAELPQYKYEPFTTGMATEPENKESPTLVTPAPDLDFGTLFDVKPKIKQKKKSKKLKKKTKKRK